MTEEKTVDIASLLSIVPPEVREFWSKYISSAYLAGGAVRSAFDGTEVSDYDFFLLSREEIEDLIDSRAIPSELVKFTCPQKQLVSIQIEGDTNYWIQVICKEDHPDVNSLLSSFDFRAVCMALSFSGDFYALPGAVEDAKAKVLKIENTLGYPVSTMRRMIKYCERGYKAHASVYPTIAGAIVDVYSSATEEERLAFRHQLTSIDQPIANFYSTAAGPLGLVGVD